MKGRFQIKAKYSEIVTDKGLRVFVMEKLLNSPFQKGSVINIDDKTVEVWLDGEKEKIEEFIRELKKDVIAEFGNPTIIFTSFAEDLKLEVPELMRSSQALSLGQLQKGISVQFKILDALEKMAEKIAELPEELAKKLKAN